VGLLSTRSRPIVMPSPYGSNGHGATSPSFWSATESTGFLAGNDRQPTASLATGLKWIGVAVANSRRWRDGSAYSSRPTSNPHSMNPAVPACRARGSGSVDAPVQSLMARQRQSQRLAVPTISAIALPTSAVLALPPMSGVRGPSARTVSIACITAAAASGYPRCSSIMAPDQI